MAKKNKKPTPEYNSQRETRVLLEQISSEVKVVAEQHGSIMKKLEQHDGRFDRLEMAAMQNSIQIKELKVSQEELKVSQEKLKTGQERIEKKLDDNLGNHETRIRRLEDKVGV